MNTETCGLATVGPAASGVAIEWSHNAKDAPGGPALFVFTELSTGNQFQYQVLPDFHTCIPLTVGKYGVAIYAKGLERYRGTLDLRPGTPTPFKPVLNAAAPSTKTLGDALARFGIGRDLGTRDFEVPRNATVVFDSDDPKFSGTWTHVAIKDAATAKRVLGHPDELWAANTARFRPAGVSLTDNPDAIARQAAHEYVYGNASTVKPWEQQINQAVFDEVWKFPLFVLGTVTINAGGVLVIGNKANFFVCQRLRMHVTATLIIRGAGPIHVEPVSLETFC